MKTKLKKLVFSFTITNGKFQWKNPALMASWMQKYEDCDGYARLEPKGKTAVDKLRRFYRGGVVPLFSWYHHIDNHEEANEILKLEFNGKFIKNLKGEEVQIGRSTSVFKKTGDWVDFIDRIASWSVENGLEPADSEDYKRWENSARMVDDKEEKYLDYFIRTRGLTRQ